MARQVHYELVKARECYTHTWAIGTVLLANGCCMFHGHGRDASALYDKCLKRQAEKEVAR